MTQPAIKRILLATDFSGCAEQALEYAAFLGNACPAPVDILHVVEILPDLHPADVLAERYFDQCRKQAEKPLDELVQRLTSRGVTARWRQRFGVPRSPNQPGGGRAGRRPRDPGGLWAHRPDRGSAGQHRRACRASRALSGVDRPSQSTSPARALAGATGAGSGGFFILLARCARVCERGSPHSLEPCSRSCMSWSRRCLDARGTRALRFSRETSRSRQPRD
jgi:hypothetical protein